MKKPIEQPKMYVVRKYIKATSVAHALRLDKTTPVHSAWIDEDWSKNHLAVAIGFDNGVQPSE